MIRINLTGDYQLDPKNGNTEVELLHLDAFLGALRGSVSAEKDLFLQQVSKIVARFKRRNMANVALQITSELQGNKLIHEFRIVEI